jgi:hypothetical protein
MATEILSPGTAPANSAEIVVVVGTPVNVGAFRDDEKPLEMNFRGLIYRKDSGGMWNPTNFSLNIDTPNQMLVGAGTYQVRRGGNITKPTGIMIN